MPDDVAAVTVLDQLAARTGAAEPPAGDTFDGLDLRGETLRPAAEALTPTPAWWDAAGGRVTLKGANLRGLSFRSANLSGADLEHADFGGADLANGVLRETQLGGANFDRALLEESDLEGAFLRFATFREGVLEGAKLRGADLWGAKLPESDVDKADFRDAQLEEADFRDADARDTDFRGAKLGLADFRGADLRTADFRGSTVRATKFDAADLRRANLEQLDLTNASLDGVWLSDVRLDRTRFHREQLGGSIGEERAGEYELARRGYLALEQNFVAIGDPPAASWAYRRRRRMEKLSARREAGEALRSGRWLRAAARGLTYLNLQLVEWVCDYGESVPRVLAAQLAVILVYTAFYAAAGTVEREDPAAPGGRVVTRSPADMVSYAMTAMLAPGQMPEGLHPADTGMQLVTLSQSYLGIFLIGLLGFVAGNRIRR